jgi:hypothetical protein
MKDAEDEAFDELAKRQGHWGGGYQTKRLMAADKLQEPPSEWASIKAILDEYGLQAIDFVADFKAALAQPAQEPVAWMYDWLCDGKLITGWIAHNEAEIPKLVASNSRPLSTSPPAQEPDALTIAYQSGYYDGKKAALAQPPLPVQPAQEPVAMYGHCPMCGAKGVNRERRLNGNDLCASGHIYPSRDSTTPPKREWVGLTDEEREQHRNDWHSNIHDKEFYAIEAKLKEKNND